MVCAHLKMVYPMPSNRPKACLAMDRMGSKRGSARLYIDRSIRLSSMQKHIWRPCRKTHGKHASKDGGMTTQQNRNNVRHKAHHKTAQSGRHQKVFSLELCSVVTLKCNVAHTVICQRCQFMFKGLSSASGAQEHGRKRGINGTGTKLTHTRLNPV